MKRNYNKEIYEFFSRCARENPKKFKEVCAKYPILDAKKIQTINDKEISQSLVGIHPVELAAEVQGSTKRGES